MWITREKLGIIIDNRVKNLKASIELDVKRITKLEEEVTELETKLEDLTWEVNNPKKYKIGESVNGFVIYDIQKSGNIFLGYSVEKKWEYLAINKKGNRTTFR